MYGLPQARILAQDLLVQRMAKHGYMQSKIVPGLWMHNKHNTTFTLVINDFGVKCTSKVDAHHLIDALNFNTIMQRLISLNKANSDMLKSISALLEKSGGSTAPGPATAATGSKQDRQHKRTEYKKRLNAVTPCAHCKKKHPNRTDDKCWELDANAVLRPAGWKLIKAAVA